MLRDIFISGSKKNTVLRVAIKVVLGYYFLWLFFVAVTFIISPNIDFPCSNPISDSGCLLVNSSYYDQVEYTNIKVYLSDFPAWARGGGCGLEGSNTSDVSVGGMYFGRDEENLVINGEVVLAVNETWENNKVLVTWDPWRLTQEHTLVKNRGLINCTEDYQNGNMSTCDSVLVATGYKESHYEANYIGIPIFLVLSGLLITSTIYSKRAGRGRDNS